MHGDQWLIGRRFGAARGIDETHLSKKLERLREHWHYAAIGWHVMAVVATRNG